MMSHPVVQDWLAKYKVLPEAELKQYASSILQKRDLASALYNLFENDASDQVVAPVCHQLFDFFHSDTPELRYFSIGMIPTLISTYLTTIGHTDTKKNAAVEACLLGMYNLEVVNGSGQAKKDELTIPTLAASSIYHEPPSLAALALTESALLRYHSDVPTIITIGPHPQVEGITAQNRFSVLTHLLRCFNADIVRVTQHSHKMLCRMCSKIVKMGFLGEANELAPVRAHSAVSTSVSLATSGLDLAESGRIAVTGSFLTELTCGVYYTMYNGQRQRGMSALNDLHQRACFELFPDVILLTNAIKNGLKQSPPGANKTNPMGISVSASPHPAGTVSKCAITNASFRAKKLPDDIATTQNGDEALREEEQSKPLQLPKPEPATPSGGGKQPPSAKTSEATAASGGGKHIKFFVKRKSRHAVEEDIEVPELSSPSDNPPSYADLMEQDGTEGKSRHSNPGKSIIKKSDKNKPRRSEASTDRDLGAMNMHHSLSVLSEESNTNTDLSLITVHMADGDTPPRRQGKEITLDILSHRQHHMANAHKRSCGFPDKSCCCAPTKLTEKSSDSYVALVDGKSGNGLTKRAGDGPGTDRGPETMNTQL